jgi:hypothetical protein
MGGPWASNGDSRSPCWARRVRHSKRRGAFFFEKDPSARATRRLLPSPPPPPRPPPPPPPPQGSSLIFLVLHIEPSVLIFRPICLVLPFNLILLWIVHCAGHKHNTLIDEWCIPDLTLWYAFLKVNLQRKMFVVYYQINLYSSWDFLLLSQVLDAVL